MFMTRLCVPLLALLTPLMIAGCGSGTTDPLPNPPSNPFNPGNPPTSGYGSASIRRTR